MPLDQRNLMRFDFLATGKWTQLASGSFKERR